MKKIIKLFLLLNLFIIPLFSQNSAVKLEKTTTFFPEQEEIIPFRLKIYWIKKGSSRYVFFYFKKNSNRRLSL